MLAHLSISDYTIISRLEVEFGAGMTVITGETGAGKSIMLDALGLCLGDRADSAAVRPGARRAEITAGFDIRAVPAAAAWLEARDLESDGQCLLRRVITDEGRSRAYINGSTTTVQECADLGRLLIDIHSQHAHQSLLRREVQRTLLDTYGDYAGVLQETAAIATEWATTQRELAQLTGADSDTDAHRQLLTYQSEELLALGLVPGELEALEQEQQVLENAEQILQTAHEALEISSGEEDSLRRALKLMSGAVHAGHAAAACRDLLDSAVIQLEEARGEIQHYIDGVEIDPQRLAAVQQRLESIYDLARKHRVQPEELTAVQEHLDTELQRLTAGKAREQELRSALDELAAAYAETASRLSRHRAAAAEALVDAVSGQLSALAMERARFDVQLTPRASDKPHPAGREEVAFLIATNPGAQPLPLSRVASGGELSRISLAIQVVCAGASTVPSMVFDEVDVGVGGAVAEVVGRLLRSLARCSQVLCVTHLPQVAAQGEHHLQISKEMDGESVSVRMKPLSGRAQVDEVARMLGGLKITDKTRAHAREMIAAAS